MFNRKTIDFKNALEYYDWIKENKYKRNTNIREVNTYEWNGGIRIEYITLR